MFRRKPKASIGKVYMVRPYCLKAPIDELLTAAVSGVFREPANGYFTGSVDGKKAVAEHILMSYRYDELLRWLKETQDIDYSELPVDWVEKALGLGG